MLIDEIREKLKSIEPDIQTIKNFWKNSKIEEKVKELEKISQKEDFWQDKNQAEVLKELQKLKNIHENYFSITKNFDESF